MLIPKTTISGTQISETFFFQKSSRVIFAPLSCYVFIQKLNDNNEEFPNRYPKMMDQPKDKPTLA